MFSVEKRVSFLNLSRNINSMLHIFVHINFVLRQQLKKKKKKSLFLPLLREPDF